MSKTAKNKTSLHLTKKEILLLLEAKISMAIQDISKTTVEASKLKKVVKKAGKLISNELHSMMKLTARPALEEASPKAVPAKKAKASKPAAKKAAKKAVKTASKKAAKKSIEESVAPTVSEA